MNKLLFLFCALVLLRTELGAQSTSPANGLREKSTNILAFTNTKIVVSPVKTISNGTLLIRDGHIEAVGSVSIPPEATVIDLHGKTIYPGFIDPYSEYGMPKTKPNKPFSDDDENSPEKKTERPGTAHWNDAVKPQRQAKHFFTSNADVADKLRAQGFTVIQSNVLDGIFRGSSVIVSLADGSSNNLILLPIGSQFLSFRKGSSSSPYPSSLMGSIALMRQTFYDKRWYGDAWKAYEKNPSLPRPEANDALAALSRAKGSFVFDAGDEQSVLRAEKIAREFDETFIYKASGYEYRLADRLAKTKAIFIVPVNFPDAPNVSTLDDERDVSFEELKEWDTAPENPARLDRAGIHFAFTANGLKDLSTFLTQVRETVHRGLSREKALGALTTVSAEICGISSQCGTLERGKLANFIVTNGDIFDSKTKIASTWIDGREYEVTFLPAIDPRGTFSLSFEGSKNLSLEVSGEAGAPEASVKMGEKKIKATSFSVKDRQMQVSFSGDSAGLPGIVRLSGTVDDTAAHGTGIFADGKTFAWTATQTPPAQKPDSTTKEDDLTKQALLPVTWPDKAFGSSHIPDQADALLIQNATVWTCAILGTLEHADVLIRHGKIDRVGKNISAPSGAIIVDGKGKHVTPGLIDEHSHIAIAQGVNEGTQAVSAEVRIADVIDATNINIYRQLAGGITTSQLLHGSANPIGGQIQVVKLRWGAMPEEFLFEGANPAIKFALGENVKQSNWGDQNVTRYPQTRMGVEEIMRDEFVAAREYEHSQKHFDGARMLPVRRDLELDAILEVLDGKRKVHCHSYVQSEILMLMRLAEEFGFRIGTFTHILEGYKVAPEMKKHGAMASSFSDWWAYKFEVYDAIPYNGAMLHDEGIITSFNSDDAEMGRRLNQEAAKAVKYGSVSEIEALKFQTINAAKQLGVEHYVGTLETGKDADVVIWDGPPLSVYSKVTETWVDGRKYFDRERDSQMRNELRTNRAALVQRILQSKKSPTGEGAPPKKNTRLYHCEDIEDEMAN